MTLQQAVNRALAEVFDLAVLRAERDAARVWRELVSQGASPAEAAEAVADFRYASDESIIAALDGLEVELYRTLSAA